MRAIPETISERDLCTIVFTPEDYDLCNGTIQSAVRTHGQRLRTEFSWVAGGGTKHYFVQRRGFGRKTPDGPQGEVWSVQAVDEEGQPDEFSIMVDCSRNRMAMKPGYYFDWETAEPVPYEFVNKTMEVILNLRAEIEERNTTSYL